MGFAPGIGKRLMAGEPAAFTPGPLWEPRGRWAYVLGPRAGLAWKEVSSGTRGGWCSSSSKKCRWEQSMKTLWPTLGIGQGPFRRTLARPLPYRTPQSDGKDQASAFRQPQSDWGENKLLPLVVSVSKEKGHQDENSLKTELPMDQGK